jgi:hypothetical protein
MTKIEALKKALDGHKIRHKSWIVGSYAYFDGYIFTDDYGYLVKDEPDDGWELYIEPKQKKLVELKCYEHNDVYFAVGKQYHKELPYIIKDGKIFIEMDHDWDKNRN